MGELASGTLSIPIRVVVEGQNATREEFLRLLKEDDTVRRAVRSLLLDTPAKEIPSMMAPPQHQAEAKKAALAQSPSCFARGWELFQKYRTLSAESRDQFANTIRHEEDFEAFICCVAQDDASEEIWEGVKRCLGTTNPQELTVLKHLLAYAVELANRTFPSPLLQVMNVQAGDSYNDNLHSIYGVNSKKQGDIAEIFLQGLMHGDKCIKKSLVRLE